jgi:hypothetical protein
MTPLALHYAQLMERLSAGKLAQFEALVFELEDEMDAVWERLSQEERVSIDLYIREKSRFLG